MVERKLYSVLTRDLDEGEVRETTRRRARHELTGHYARRAALRSFVLGLPGGGFVASLGFVDTRHSLSLRTELAAALAHHDDPALFEDPTWRARVVGAAYGVPDHARDVKNVAVRAARDTVLRRGARFVVRRLAATTAPVAGSVVGAGLAYAWMHREGRRMDASMRRVPAEPVVHDVVAVENTRRSAGLESSAPDDRRVSGGLENASTSAEETCEARLEDGDVSAGGVSADKTCGPRLEDATVSADDPRSSG